MDMIKLLNVLHVHTNSSVLHEMDLQFASEHLPAKVQFGCPNRFAAYDYLASPEELELLEDN